MAIQRTRLQLGMELAAQEPRMPLQFHDLDEAIVRRGAGGDESGLLELRAVGVVYFVTMAMALVDFRAAVQPRSERTRLEHARPRPQPHRAAFFADALLRLHDVDHRMRRFRIDLSRIR